MKEEIVKELEVIINLLPHQTVSQILFNAIDLYLLKSGTDMSFSYLEDGELLLALVKYKNMETKHG